MNRDIYRLVFNEERNAWLAVAETVRGRGKSSARRKLAKVALGLSVAVYGASAIAALPAKTLPVASTTRPFVYSGKATTTTNADGNAMTISTSSRALGLNWKSFNISSDASVTFVQPDSTSRVVNRIWDNSPSEIAGRLTANGEIYLINLNGVVFSGTAQVNVAGLVASSLNLSESAFDKLLNSGLPTASGDSLAFSWDGTAAGFNAGYVAVDSGATISTPGGGRVVLLAPNSVTNNGTITNDGGETILAAGGKVILTVPDNPNLRGLLVETESFTGKDALGNSVTLDGSVTNDNADKDKPGSIDSGSTGVVTLAALVVNQKGVVNAGRAVNLNGTTMLVAGTTETDRLTINQRGDVAQIDWLSGFNVGTGQTIEFVQKSAGAVAYNYINDADRTLSDGTVLDDAGRSTIDGTLKANGQLVLINEQGFDFSGNARVSASNFVASALGMNPDIVDTGLLGQTDVGTRAFYLNPTAASYRIGADESDSDSRKSVSAAALAAFRAATVNVAAGAQISSASGGYVLLAGSKVNNYGRISSPGGQTLLAAGADLYLKPAYSSAVRGFTAEVNPLYIVDDSTEKNWLALSRGDDANAIYNGGSILASLGDITLVGNTITQAGLLYASTSATANGSIHLIARDQLNTAGAGEPTVLDEFYRQYDDQGVIIASSGTDLAGTEEDTTDFVAGRVGGTLTFADDSVTNIAIDGSDGKTLTSAQDMVVSTIDAVAQKIVVNDADIIANGGKVNFSAREDFTYASAFAVDPANAADSATPPAGVGIYVDKGATIDVSGTDAYKSVADLFIAVELRGDEFADNPLQRNGILRGQTAWVDIRDAVDIADLSGWLDAVSQTVYEKAATGGSISLSTTGSAIVKSGATLDVSGGAINYAAGTVKESYAVTAGGKSYRLNDAPSSQLYGSMVTQTHNEAAYVEGRSAGTIKISGHSLAVDGTLKGNTTVGTRQRESGDASTTHYATPYGGQLIIEDSGQHYVVADAATASEEEKIKAYTEAQVVFVKGAATAASDLDADSSAGARLELSQSLVDNGFSRFSITSDGRIEIPAEVTLALPTGGSFSASGRQIVVAGDISAPSGEIALTTRDMSDSGTDFPSEAKYSTLTIASTAALSTAGRWVNDYLDGKNTTVAKATDGGSITLSSAYDIDLSAGSSLNVSGGAWLSNAKELTAGDAGSITLVTGGVEDSGFELTDNDRRDATLFLDGTLSGYALGEGGTLTVKTSQITFGETFTADSRNWTRDQRLANDQVGAAFGADIVDQGGFFNFNFVGRDGVTVADNVTLSPDPVSWSFRNSNNYLYQKTGSAIARFAQASVLHSDRRSASTDLTLAATSRLYGDLLIGNDAYVGVSAQGSVTLSALGQLSVFGTIEAPAGTITLTRSNEDAYNDDADAAYTDDKQSESIYLGADSQLLARGTTVLTARTRQALEAGLSAAQLQALSAYKGSLLGGGKVSIDAGLGYVITRAGSLIDVSGATATLNQTSLIGATTLYPLTTSGSSGGNIAIAARDGMWLDGSYQAAGGSNALGGKFSLSFGDSGLSSNPWNIVIPSDTADLTDDEVALTGERVLTLYQSSGGHGDGWPADLDDDAYQTLGEHATITPASYNGKAELDVAQLAAGGFGSWYLSSQDTIAFSGSISATVNNQLSLNASRFSAVDDATRVALTAAAVQLGNNTENAGTPESSATIGKAVAEFNALDIGLVGTFSWNGFGSTTLTSMGEIHFDSVTNSGLTGRRTDNGQMTASGDLTLAAARLSPSTYSDYRVDLLSDPDSKITVTRPAGSSADKTLSVGGLLELAASTIYDEGTITAPLGKIVFNADGGSVTLAPGSITSVSADSNMLFGYTSESGSAWNYNGTEITSMPEKGIEISGETTVVASGATVDLSGGGDALAWEFIAGTGGSSDILAGSTTTFAIIPGWSGTTAGDSSLLASYGSGADQSLSVGDSISLGANAYGLSGNYVLLPARYAVLAGAYLVTVKTTDGTLLRSSSKQLDGSVLVNATVNALNANGTTTAYSTTGWTVEVASSSVVAQRASYTTTSANEFFYDTAGSTLAGDAGQLSVVGSATLSFNPTVVAMRAAEISAADGRTRAGQGLQLDLAAPKLLVSDGSTTVDSSWSTLDQNTLNAIGASSLLIGGVRTVSGTTTTIETIATDVKVANSGSALNASEVMLTATDTVTLATGSAIESSGTAVATTAIALSGDGAFLRAAEGEQVSISRAGSVERIQGDLVVEAGTRIGGEALVFDATHDTTLAGAVTLGELQSDGSRGDGGSISIGAGRINVVGDQASTTPVSGLTLGNDDLKEWESADQIRLTSYSTLDLYGNAEIGTASIKELVIAAAGIAGYGDPGSVAKITAQSVSFENPKQSASFTANGTLGSGTLAVNAETITLGSNATTTMRTSSDTGFALRGFSSVGLAAKNDLRFSGTGVTTVDNDAAFGGSGAAAALDISAGRVVAAAGANHLLTASGATTINGSGTTVAATSSSDLGGSLKIAAQSIDVSGTISTPAGTLTLSGSDYVHLGSGAYVAAEGTAVAFKDTYAYASGGTVTLESTNGDVVVDDGATVSVAADTRGGDAGTVALQATKGTVSTAAATLRGSATTGYDQGKLTVDANRVNLDQLAAAVSGSGKTELGGTWDIRARSGDLTLANTITAQNVSIAADKGGIAIAETGKIDASASQGGDIALYASQGDIVLDGTLLARGTEVISDTDNAGTRGQGGTVLLAASGSKSDGSAAQIITTDNSVIDVGVADGSVATGGKVNFRAAKTTATSFTKADDLNIKLAAGGTITGASDVGVEIVSNYSGTTLNATGTGTSGTISLAAINSQLSTLYSTSNVSAIRTLLGFSDATYHVRAGVEIDSASNLTIGSDLDFSALRFAGEAGVLTLRAAGNIAVNNTISDGFSKAATSSTGTFAATGRDAKVSSDAQSWSYRLIAGADTGAAKLTAVNTAKTGNITVATNKMIRTGSGDITLAAGGNVALKGTAAVYTAGRDTTSTLANFTAVSAGDTSATGSRAHYTYNGGDIDVSAGGDITQDSTGAISDWLIAYSDDGENTQWWSRIASFQTGFAAFGGGDITLAAGGNLTNVTAVIPTNGRVPSIDGVAQVDTAVIQGGGNLVASAGGNISGGIYYAETGRLNLSAGDSIVKDTVIAVGNTKATVKAAGSIALGNIYNPLAIQKTANKVKSINSSGVVSNLTGQLSSNADYLVRIGTYGEDSSIDVLALKSDVDISSATDADMGIAPAEVKVAALAGSIKVDLLQMPGTSGQLDLLAANNIDIGTLIQYDIDASRLPSIGQPVLSGDSYDPFDLELTARLRHSDSLWHADDYQPTRLVALTGDISGSNTLDVDIVLNEAVTISAGADINNLNIEIQHAHASDVSSIVAGGDVRYDYYNDSTSQVGDITLAPIGIRLGGEGAIEVSAGGDIDLADSWGIVTRGNLDNPFLPESSASILAVAGTTPDYESLRSYLELGSEVSDSELRQRFFALLKKYGSEAQAGGGEASYAKGRALASAFFPDADSGKGDIKLSVSQIKTEQGGDIHLLAPSGSVIVGVASPTLDKKASQQGIFTLTDGDIMAYVDNNFQVNQSRVFTLDGGDITIWADSGDIDAGNGAKTVVSTPAPVLLIRDGQVVLDTSNSVTGSGIGVLASKDDTPASDMSLFAPEGTIDAGDAGLRSTGNIVLGARAILNSSNIQAAGNVAGAPAPAAAAAPVSTAPSTPKTSDASETQATAAAVGSHETVLGTLTVELLDSGGEAATNNASDAAYSEDEEEKKKR